MNSWQEGALGILGIISFWTVLLGYAHAVKRQNPFGETPYLFWLGIFVWGDALLFGIFWLFMTIIPFLFRDWLLFCVLVSLFWVVRSCGEVVYWINQQFTSRTRNLPQNLRGYQLFSNESIWFVYQVIWQCVAVIALVSTIYFVYQWLQSL